MQALGSFRGLTLLALASSKSRIVPSARTLLLPARAPLLRSINTFPANPRDHSNRATAREMDLHHALNDACRRLIPPLTSESYKGSQGKVCVVGGCIEFTGAPYLAAISSLKVGADLAYVLCMETASVVIKTYSPELIVLPYLPQGEENIEEAMSRITPWLARATVVVVGPGLGDDPAANAAALKVVEATRAANKPLLVDGSGINIVTANPNSIRGYLNCILTPNINELGRLAKAVNVKLDGPMGVNWQKHTQEIAAAFGGVTIVAKGPSDLISNGSQSVRCQAPSSLRRAGGQGDVLAGTMAAFMCWSTLPPSSRTGGSGSLSSSMSSLSSPPTPPVQPTMLTCAYGGCLVTRTASLAAFQEAERSMLAGDVTRHLPHAFKQLFGDHF